MDPVTVLPCSALLAWPPAPILDDPVGLPDQACIYAELDIAAQLAHERSPSTVSTPWSVPRSRLELGLSYDDLLSVRVATRLDGGAVELGLSATPPTPTIEIAEARVTVPPLGTALAAGLIDDPWVVSGERAWTYRPLAPVLAERQGWLGRSDLGGVVTFNAPRQAVEVHGRLTAGEGVTGREQTAGIDGDLTVVVRPFRFWSAPQPDLVVLAALFHRGRDPVADVNAHRYGLRVHTRIVPACNGIVGSCGAYVAGLELLVAHGVNGAGGRSPLGTSLWAVVDANLGLTATTRLDLISQEVGDQGSWLLAAGARHPVEGSERRVGHLVVGYQRDWVEGGDTAHTIFVQLARSVRIVAPVTAR